MIIKDDERSFQLINSKKSQIKYIILLLAFSALFILFNLSIFNLFSGQTLFLGNTLSNLLANLTFLIGGNIIFIILTLLIIYGSIKNLIKSKKIVFDKVNKKAVFITHHRFFKEDIFKKIPFSEISEIRTEQEQESEYITLSILHKNKKITVDSDYGAEGLEKLNNLAESIQKFVKAPLQKGQFEDIYIEEEDEEKEDVKKEKSPIKVLSN